MIERLEGEHTERLVRSAIERGEYIWLVINTQPTTPVHQEAHKHMLHLEMQKQYRTEVMIEILEGEHTERLVRSGIERREYIWLVMKSQPPTLLHQETHKHM